MQIKNPAFVALCAAAAALAPAAAAAQDYPNKPVKILIGFAPGGPTDLIGRIISDHMSKALGQPFVVEAKPGASGIVSGQATIAAPADGYTLNLTAPTMLVAAPAMYTNMAFDPAKVFVPITPLVKSTVVLEVGASLPPKTYQEFIPWAKANTGKLNHGSPGVGTTPHLAAQLFLGRIGFESQHIPYRGTGPHMQGMMQKEIQWSFNSPSGSVGLLRGGHVRLLAVAEDKRWPEFPDVPTLGELGMKDAVWHSWFGLIAATGTPKPIIDRLAAESAKAWEDPENVKRVRAIGFVPWTTSPEEMGKFVAAERERWTAVIKANNIKAE
ncbi:MAG: Bug family tripartite tricarboxylate transporter substrate binding protein [Rhodospirillales bacterium]